MMDADRIKMKRNIQLMYVYTAINWFMVFIPIAVPFFKENGLDMQQIYLLQAFFSLCIIIFEVPSGYMSDLWGRKKTLFVSTTFGILSGIMLVIADGFVDLLIFEFLVAICISMRSGTDLSVLYDSSLLYHGPKKQSKILSDFLTVANFSEGIAALGAGILSFWNYKYAVWAFLIKFVISIVPLFFIEEPPRKLMDKKAHKDNFKMILRFIRWGDELIFLIFLNLVFYGLATYVVVWAYQHIWGELGIEVLYFGFLWAALNLATAFFAKMMPWLETKILPKNIIVFMGLLPIVGYFGFSWWSVLPVVALGFLFSLTRAITAVILKEAFNSRVPSEFRATANSLHNLGFRITFVVIGPFAGYLIDQKGTDTMMALFGWIYVAVFILLLLPFVMKIKRVHAKRSQGVSS